MEDLVKKVITRKKKVKVDLIEVDLIEDGADLLVVETTPEVPITPSHVPEVGTDTKSDERTFVGFDPVSGVKVYA